MNQDLIPTHNFYTKTGLSFSGYTMQDIQRMRKSLHEDHEVSEEQISEAASYSFAMVIRYALGLSAISGKVTAIVNDSLAGCISLATLRHLANAGADVQVIAVGNSNIMDIPGLRRQFSPLRKMGVPISVWSSTEDNPHEMLIKSSHSILCGLYKMGAEPSALENHITSILNEVRNPIHAVEAPLGVNVDSGAAGGCPLFASTTLSLGAPFNGLASGAQFVGRHYVCDISLTRQIYTETGQDLTPLFAEQPVVQIFPLEKEN